MSSSITFADSSALPDPALFDPVRFPGQDREPWPPPSFDFAAPWLSRDGLVFEREASGDISVVRRFEHMRLLVRIETAHRTLDIEPGSRDFRLLRLVPAALRFCEQVSPGDPVPPILLGDDAPPPEEHHLYAATTVLIEALGERAGEEGRALAEAIRRVPPGQDMFERAVVHCMSDIGMRIEGLAPVARRLQRLANAHARVLSAYATQPDYEAMENMIFLTRRTLTRDRRWAGDLLTHALAWLEQSISRPRHTAEALSKQADARLRKLGAMADMSKLVVEQEKYHARLLDIATFWRRLSAAWLAVHPETTDRRDVEALARNAIRRLSLKPLYDVPS
ncbi:hypothetical protein IAI18_16435 [Acetobacteraceae bacterium H6797]|nr:hypothetical protein [Acetobacteraceae bacterium H6797]